MIWLAAADTFHLADFVEGSVHWAEARAGTLRVHLRWDAKGLVSTIAYNIIGELTHEVTQVAGSLPFRWRLPHGGPMTFTGTALSVAWRICAELDFGTRAAETAEMAIHVLPRVVRKRAEAAA